MWGERSAVKGRDGETLQARAEVEHRHAQELFYYGGGMRSNTRRRRGTGALAPSLGSLSAPQKPSV